MRSALCNQSFRAAVGIVGLSWCLMSSGQAQNQLSADSNEAPQAYQVEVIIFAHQDFDPSEEQLDVSGKKQLQRLNEPVRMRYFDALSALMLRKLVELPIIAPGSDESSPPPFPNELLALERFSASGQPLLDHQLLTSAELQLGDQFSRISRLSAYRPIAHGGWIQLGLPEEQAIPFDVRELRPLGVLGTIRLHVSRFLHVTVDLRYRPPRAAPASTPSSPLPPLRMNTLEEITAGPIYEMRADRRILRGELNYIDHPAFGILVLITLAPELPELQPEPTETNRPAA